MGLIDSVLDIINGRTTMRRAVQLGENAEPSIESNHYDAKTGDYLWGGLRHMTSKEKKFYAKHPEMVIQTWKSDNMHSPGFR